MPEDLQVKQDIVKHLHTQKELRKKVKLLNECEELKLKILNKKNKDMEKDRNYHEERMRKIFNCLKKLQESSKKKK